MSRTEADLVAEFMGWARTIGGPDNVIECKVSPEYGRSYCKVEVGLLGDPISIKGLRAETYHRFILSRDTHTEVITSHSWRNERLGIPHIQLKGTQTTICTFMVESVLLRDLAKFASCSTTNELSDFVLKKMSQKLMEKEENWFRNNSIIGSGSRNPQQ